MTDLSSLQHTQLPIRENAKIQRFDQLEKTSVLSEHTIWYDTRKKTPDELLEIFPRLSQKGYSGVILYRENLAEFLPMVPARFKIIFDVDVKDGIVESEADLIDTTLDALAPKLKKESRERLIVASSNHALLRIAQGNPHQTCLRHYVDDAESLHAAIDLGRTHPYLMIHFRDPTNIPLELVIASLQASGTVLIKEINAPTDVEDAVVSLGVMEFGADGVVFSPDANSDLDRFFKTLTRAQSDDVALDTATIIRTEPVGMGFRSCVDVATLFQPTEGILVGSTSQGGLLCCPEVFHLPYMDLRPFRVNAGAVHSYVFNVKRNTNYMTELKAGSDIMIVNQKGEARRAIIGRMKTELRPLRLIVARFASGEEINVLMQDDWHVRIFSDKAKPLNITELKPGDKVLAHLAQPGRHVGIKIDEEIIES